MNITPDTHPPGLNAILYSLYYITDVYDESAYKNLEKELSSKYSKNMLLIYRDALQWSISNQSIDFSKRLPNLHQSNDEIIHFIIKTKDMLDTIIKELD